MCVATAAKTYIFCLYIRPVIPTAFRFTTNFLPTCVLQNVDVSSELGRSPSRDSMRPARRCGFFTLLLPRVRTTMSVTIGSRTSSPRSSSFCALNLSINLFNKSINKLGSLIKGASQQYSFRQSTWRQPDTHSDYSPLFLSLTIYYFLFIYFVFLHDGQAELNDRCVF